MNTAVFNIISSNIPPFFARPCAYTCSVCAHVNETMKFILQTLYKHAAVHDFLALWN